MPEKTVGRYTVWGMCRAVTCKQCKKPTWAGCGAHVEQVLGHIPQSERCQCKSQSAQATTGTKTRRFFGR